MRVIYTTLFSLIFSFLSWSSLANVKEQPDVLLKRVTQELITDLRKEDKELKERPSHIYDIIDNILVPYVDWTTMAQWVVGRNAWMSATEKQKTRFSEEFKESLNSNLCEYPKSL